MNKEFKSYSFFIEDKPFIDDDKIISEKTVFIKLFKDENDFDTHKFAYFDGQEIKNIIKKDKSITLDKVFIDTLPEINSDLKKIKITNSFILSDSIDIRIKVQYQINFKGSFFISQNINLSKSEFNCFSDFSNVLFKSETLNFSQCKFNKGVTFKNSRFSGDIKNFEKIFVQKGELIFTNSDFGDGNVSFQESKFGQERTYFTMARFGKGFIDFTRTKFGGNDIFFERTDFGNGNISFRSANFGDGSVDFRRSHFGQGEKNFMRVNFGNGSVKFVNSHFKAGKITFRLADFGKGNVDFHYTNFGKTDVFFERAKFSTGTLNFRGVEIQKGRINFNHLDFSDGDFIFESLEHYNGIFYLRNSVFGRGFINFENSMCQNIDFIIENVDFGYGSVSFHNAKFNKIKLKGSQINSYFDFRFKYCQILDLSNTVINDVLDLSPTDKSLNVKTLYLQGVRLLGRIYLDWDTSNVVELIKNQKVSARQKSEQFRILKENYRTMGLYEYEDLAYVEFKRMQAIAKLEDIKKEKFFKKIKSHILYWLELLIFDKMGHYATNPVRVLKSMGIIYLIFSFVYLILEYIFPQNALILSSLFNPDSPQVMSNISKAFYHSAITFLTIGYGDYYPVGIIRILSSIEGFIGLFLMSYFTVAFVRKILR